MLLKQPRSVSVQGYFLFDTISGSSFLLIPPHFYLKYRGGMSESLSSIFIVGPI